MVYFFHPFASRSLWAGPDPMIWRNITMDYAKESLRLHYEWHGKLDTVP